MREFEITFCLNGERLTEFYCTNTLTEAVRQLKAELDAEGLRAVIEYVREL